LLPAIRSRGASSQVRWKQEQVVCASRFGGASEFHRPTRAISASGQPFAKPACKLTGNHLNSSVASGMAVIAFGGNNTIEKIRFVADYARPASMLIATSLPG
jgi:hypothetical protein